MANEVKVTGEPGQTDLTYRLFYDNSGTMTARGSAAPLTEQPANSGVYTASPAVIEPGDVIVIYKGTMYAGSEEYQPQVELAPSGLDNLPAGEPTGPAVTVLEKILQLYARFFNQVKKDKVTKTITVYQADDTTPMTEQTYVESGVADILGKAT